MPRLRTLLCSLFTLLLLAFASSAWAKVANITLGELIKGSDYIVLAHVESIETMNGLRVARAVPEQEFKNAAGQKPFYFVAEQTWTCDMSSAIEGETVLLFLNRIKQKVIQRGLLHKPPVAVSIKSLFSISDSGRGRLPIRVVNDKTYVTGFTSEIVLPPKLKALRSIQLSDIVKLIPQSKATVATR